MAHFAEIDENNIIIQVLVVPDEQEHRGHEYLSVDLSLGGTWLKCSYNTRGGVHYDPETNKPSGDQSKAFRKNYPGIGFSYNEELDAFIPPKPFPSWVLSHHTYDWKAPIAPPSEDEPYIWNEDTLSWVLVSMDVNTASKEELETLDGVGPSLAQAIIDGRPWASINDLTSVSGISQAMVDGWNVTV